MSPTLGQSVPQSVLLRTTHAAWLGFSVIKLMWSTRCPKSRSSLPAGVISAFFSPSFTVSSTQLRWCVSILFSGFFDACSSTLYSMQYWGYAKYRYRSVYKSNFSQAKAAALEALDSCPRDTICRFINRAWRFMDAYRSGLTGKAAEWAVKKQKSHRAISSTAMGALDVI